MNIRVEGAKMMLSESFLVPVDELYKHFTEPASINEWFQPTEAFTTNYAWGFVCSNGGPNAGLCFGTFGEQLPPLVSIATPEEKAKLTNFDQQQQSPTVNCPVITAWCQDADEFTSRLWFRHVFESDSECLAFSESSYVEFWELQFQNFTKFLAS